MRLAQRHDCKDFLSLFAAKDWQPLAHVALPTQDAAGLAFSPDGTCFAVWDSALEFQVLVYGLDGSCLASHRAHTDGLGIKSVAWSSTGQLLAVGTYEQVRSRQPAWKLLLAHTMAQQGVSKLVTSSMALLLGMPAVGHI